MKSLFVASCYGGCAIFTAGAYAGPGTPEQGGGWIAVAYDYTHMQKHLDNDGSEGDVGSMNSNSVTTQVEYGVTDRLAVFAGLPYVQKRYTGSYPHTNVGPDGVVHVSPTDDGSYHGSFQDVVIGTKYQMGVGNWLVTPTVDYGRPTHDYPTFTHAAIGSNETRTDVGVLTGRILPEPFDRFYVELNYLYSIVEKFQGIRANHSTAFLETDYFATDRLMLRLFTIGQKTHDGAGPSEFRSNPEAFEHHEQIGRADSIDVGVGANYLINGRYSVFSSVLHNIWGENIHQIKYDVQIGISRAF